jgi:integrase
MKVDFDVRTLESLTIPQGKQKVTLTDIRTQGLQFELRKNGGFFNYRYSLHGRQRGIPIGRYGVLKITDARKRALELARMVALGQDPLTIKDEQRQCPTFHEFFMTKYLPFVKVDKRSWGTDDSLYRNHIKEVFGDIKMNQITKGKVRDFLHSKVAMGSAKGTVNRMLVLLRYNFNLAIDWETTGVTDNPARGVKPFQENNKIERYVTQDESLALKLALEQSDNPMLKYIIAFLLVTGARKQEALKARWEDIDLTANVWRIPLSKSGKVRHITLSETAVNFLTLVQGNNAKLLGAAYESCPYVFPNAKTLKPFCTIFYSWDTARKRAGLPEVRIHDLRHTFASTLVNNGVSLYEVQKLLGHAHIRTTERYAHLKQERLQESASFAGKTFEHILNTPNPILVTRGDQILPMNYSNTGS